MTDTLKSPMHALAIEQDIEDAVNSVGARDFRCHGRVLFVAPSSLFARSGGQRNVVLLTVGLSRLGMDVCSLTAEGGNADFLRKANVPVLTPQILYIEQEDLAELYVRLCFFRQAWLSWRAFPTDQFYKDAACSACDAALELFTFQATATTCSVGFELMRELPAVQEALMMVNAVMQLRFHAAKWPVDVVVADMPLDVLASVLANTAKTAWYVQNTKLHADDMILAHETQIIACSDTVIATRFEDMYFRRPAMVVPNGIAKERLLRPARGPSLRAQYQIPEDATIFGVVGAVIPEKDQLTVIKAFSMYRRSQPNAFLLLVGHLNEEYGKSVQQRIDLLQLQSHVLCLGERDDIAALLAQFDVFVSASWAEGYGLASAEAMMAARPVLFSDIVALRALGGAAARYFPVGDAHELTERMLCLQTKEQRLQWGNRARVRAEHHIDGIDGMLQRFATSVTQFANSETPCPVK